MATGGRSVLAAMLAAASIGGTAQQAQAQDAPVVPLLRAHAHNDYEHERPLLDALDHGFTSVEADVWLVDGELLVAHDRENVRRERTLRSLYLRPLTRRIESHGGSVYSVETPFQLMMTSSPPDRARIGRFIASCVATGTTSRATATGARTSARSA